MTIDQYNYVKIRFEVEDEDDPERVEVETVWAKPLDSGYQIDNIPFWAYGVASGDIVEATADEDGVLVFARVLESSGNSVIRLLFANEKNVQRTRDELRAMGCASELMGTKLVAVEVPATADYSQVRNFVEAREAEGVLEYEEACLGVFRRNPTLTGPRTSHDDA